MSLRINDISPTNIHPLNEYTTSTVTDPDDVARLDRYLAIVENNKKACAFVPNDTLVALDMAGYAVDRVIRKPTTAALSVARLALALVQPDMLAPSQ